MIAVRARPSARRHMSRPGPDRAGQIPTWPTAILHPPAASFCQPSAGKIGPVATADYLDAFRGNDGS